MRKMTKACLQGKRIEQAAFEKKECVAWKYAENQHHYNDLGFAAVEGATTRRTARQINEKNKYP